MFYEFPVIPYHKIINYYCLLFIIVIRNCKVYIYIYIYIVSLYCNRYRDHFHEAFSLISKPRTKMMSQNFCNDINY
jgi:hypothetical protein